MSEISDAIGLELLSEVVGYKITKGNFQEVTPNLPQAILMIGEANTANQATLEDARFQIISAKQAGDKCGYGSPIYLAARILFPPLGGGGIGGIPVWVHPQAEEGGATAKVLEISPTGVATDNGTHYVIVAGRNGMEAEVYAINIIEGDTTGDITGKITDALSKILGCPFTAVDDDYVNTLTSKWKGLTADELQVRVDTKGNDLGITYAVSSIQSGSGTPSIANAMNALGNEWIPLVLNGYGPNATTVVEALEAKNGIPDPNNPTGRYTGIIMKPFIALTGDLSDDPTPFSNAAARKAQVTIALCPAPNSEGLSIEAAANAAVLFGRLSQDKPHLDISGQSYPDMPTPDDIGSMSDYLTRDQFLKKGSSTVDLNAGKFVVKDFVTTYHPDGEVPPQFRYCRNLMLDFNIRFRYLLLEQIHVVNKAIAADDDDVDAEDVIKPKQWLALLSDAGTDWAKEALITDIPFFQKNIKVGLSQSNPDRINTAFKYKRTGFSRQSSTTAEAGFNFGK